MIQKKNSIIANIKQLSDELDLQYCTELNFRNHCYLRIAYDNIVQNKWDIVIKRPFVKYATENQLQNAAAILQLYKSDKKRLLTDNEKSLGFRKNAEDIKTKHLITLF